MNDSGDEANATSQLPDFELNEVVWVIGIILYNSIKNYWLSRSDAEESIKRGYNLLSRLLESGDITFRVDGHDIYINRQKINQDYAEIQTLIAYLASLDATNFTFAKGMSIDDFKQFAFLFELPPTAVRERGGFAATLAGAGLKSIMSKNIVLREITEEEVVISKSDLSSKTGTEGGAGNILAFLKGEVTAPDESAVTKTRETISDAAAMADLILKAAEIRPGSPSLPGAENIGKLVVGCLRRLQHGLIKEFAATTPRGQRQLSRNLILLEKEILQRMREIAGLDTEAAATEVRQAIQEMTRELKIDALASDYMKRKQATESGESQLIGLIREASGSAGDMELLKTKLTEKGLSLPGWNELLVKSGVQSPGTGEAGGGLTAASEALTHLATVLSQMDRQFDEADDEKKHEQIRNFIHILTGVNREIGNLTQSAIVEIQKLIVALNADAGAAASSEQATQQAGKGPQLTRQEILTIIARMVHIINEPLDIIKTTLDMLESKKLGHINLMQSKALNIASESATRIKSLISNLETVAASLPTAPTAPPVPTPIPPAASTTQTAQDPTGQSR